MARNRHGKRVCGASLGNRSDRLWRANHFGDHRVGRSPTNWNLPQRLPYTLLKRSTADIEREIKTQARLLHKTPHFRYQRFVPFLIASEIRLGKLILQIAN